MIANGNPKMSAAEAKALGLSHAKEGKRSLLQDIPAAVRFFGNDSLLEPYSQGYQEGKGIARTDNLMALCPTWDAQGRSKTKLDKDVSWKPDENTAGGWLKGR